ncbi:MAG: hypothetical protein C0442_10255 [Chlorobiaceae bacterium]|nr:hypothetical protein [Chlorobiaceae bacterium]
MKGFEMPISELWYSSNYVAWEQALKRYWDFVMNRNIELEKRLNELDINRLQIFTPQEWYNFLHDEYFRWKYTAQNRYVTTTNQLRKYIDANELNHLDNIRKRILNLDPSDIRMGLNTAKEIKGLGIAGASGLLSLIYPKQFGTVDQFAVDALSQVSKLPEACAIKQMNQRNKKGEPKQLSITDGLLLIDIYSRKAKELNSLFFSSEWTPRKIDMVLWVGGR